MLESIERWLTMAERVSDKRAETLVAEMRNAVASIVGSVGLAIAIAVLLDPD